MKYELRYGYVCELYYRYLHMTMPTQLDLLYAWFGHLAAEIEETDGSTKKAPYFDENAMIIHAVKYHDHLYTGGDTIISQLCGRLIGTAKGNREKQRRNAVLFQKKISRVLGEEYEEIESLQQRVWEKLCELGEEEFTEFTAQLLDFIVQCAIARSEMSPLETDGEPFPMDDEIFDTVIYNAAYQYLRYNAEGLVNSYLWLLIGSLLRNEAGRLTRRFDSSFIEVNRMPGQERTLLARLDYLLFPEDYEYTYSGDDTESRFPDIHWKCDECGALLNDQEGFDDHLDVWQCRKCGALNPINAEAAFECEEDAANNIRHMEEDKLQDAIRRRKEELIQNEG